MTDRIALRGLRARGHHGVLEAEQQLGQEFVVDLDLALDLSAPGRSDDIADTVHYGLLAERVVEIVETERFALIEALAERIAAVVLEDVRVAAVEVTVHKPAAPIAVPFGDVAVTVARSAAR